MAGVSMKDIKSRIKSLESTKQITKAMQMVAASKLRHAQERVIHSRPYFEVLYDALSDIADVPEYIDSPFLKGREIKKTCYVVIAGDRGLAGGYNHNVFRMVMDHMSENDSCVLPVGKKALEYFRARNIEIVTEEYLEAAEVSAGDCFSLAKMLVKEYAEEKFDAVYVVYTNFVSVLSQVPAIHQLLPLDVQSGGVHVKKTESLTMYEPSMTAVYNAIVPECVGGMVYCALCESVASEQAARRAAMDSATKNAEEMIDSLSMLYNRLRQGAITQQITEIIAGAEE